MSNSSEENEPKTVPVQFHYIKGPNFKAVHVDGALGGVTPRALIHMAVYSERAAIPRIVEQTFNSEDGTMSPDQKIVEGRSGIVREVEADLFFDLHTAIEIRDWLEKKITELTRFEESTKKKPQDA